MSFWSLSDGSTPKGDAESSHVGSFAQIPDGTQAPAIIKDFILDQTDKGSWYKISWQIVEGDFKGRVVFQKIKCFEPKKETADRALNMLKRIYDLTQHKPTHGDAPSTSDLMPMKGKVLGIKISEWSMSQADGSFSQGNYVSEVHPISGFETVVGTPMVVTSVPIKVGASKIDSVTGLPFDDSGIPF